MAKYTFEDLIKNVDQHKANLHEFYLDLKSWRKFESKFKLNWQQIKFDSQNQINVPKERGIYTFTAALSSSELPIHGYIMYMGIAGEESGGTLNSRFQNYLGDLRRKSGRPKVYYMLEKWKGDLFFSFVSVPDRRVSLRKLETEFLSAIRPPINVRDFEASITHARSAAF